MKTIKHLARSLFLTACTLAFAPCADAAASSDYWASVNTRAYEGDTKPGTEKVWNYQAYYCTRDAAQAMFQATTVDGINDYLRENFATGKKAMGETEGSFAIDESGYHEKGQYTFIEYYSAAIPSVEGGYFAVAFYQDEAFRVFGNDNAVLKDGRLVFDDAAGVGTVGEWVAVPEPTGGVLLLLGFAALSLRRKRG